MEEDVHSVGVTCPKCGTEIIVMRPEVFEAVGKLWGLEGEVGFAKKLATDKAQTGAHLAVFDVNRFYACPECGERGQLPPDDELRRLDSS